MKIKLLAVSLLLISTTAYANVQNIICANPNDEETAIKLWDIGLKDMVIGNFVQTGKCVILK